MSGLACTSPGVWRPITGRNVSAIFDDKGVTGMGGIVAAIALVSIAPMTHLLWP